MNKKIPIPLAILIIVLVIAAIIGIAILACPKIPKSNSYVQTQNETADWQTYRNEEYGFEIKYPSNFIVDDIASETANYILLLEIGDAFSIGIEKEIYTLEQKIEDYRFSPMPIPKEELEEVVIGQANYKAKKWSYEGLAEDPEPGTEEVPIINFTEYFIEHEGNLYQIHYYIHPLLPEEIFNQVLSTFRFID